MFFIHLIIPDSGFRTFEYQLDQMENGCIQLKQNLSDKYITNF